MTSPHPTAPAEGRTPPDDIALNRVYVEASGLRVHRDPEHHARHFAGLQAVYALAASASETPAPTAPEPMWLTIRDACLKSSQAGDAYRRGEIDYERMSAMLDAYAAHAEKIIGRAAPPAAPAPKWLDAGVEETRKALFDADDAYYHEMSTDGARQADLEMRYSDALKAHELACFRAGAMSAAPAAPAAAIREFPQPERCDLCGEVFPEGDAHDCAARPESGERT